MGLEEYKLNPKWSKSKEEIWESVFEPLILVEPREVRTISLNKRWILYAVAACFVGFLLLSSFAFLYTQNYYTPRGEHLSVILPDGSKVDLNAESNLSFKPYWWNVSRSVFMSGEAYFEVSKGDKFVVSADYGSVKVLGTTFNVKARSEEFAVTCITGKVEVAISNNKVILSPSMEARKVKSELVSSVVVTTDDKTAWIRNHFIFNNTPLEIVLLDIERQYNIKISRPNSVDYSFTGNFYKTDDPKEVLRIIGKPFGLNFEIIL